MDEDLEAELRRLPLRAIVAFAARCARRVQPLYRPKSEKRHPADHERAIERAIKIAEHLAFGTAGDAVEATAREAASDAAREAASDAAWAAEAAASEAGVAAGDAARGAALRDLQILLSLNLGRFPELGRPVDATEAGPLGPFWPDGAPEWFTRPPAREDESSTPAEHGTEGEPSLVIVWDPDLVSPEGYEKLFTALGDLVRAEGGLGIERVRSRGFGVPCETGVPR